MCAESEADNARLVRFVHGSELLRELSLGDVWARGVQDVDDHLAARQEAVGDEFAGAQRHWR